MSDTKHVVCPHCATTNRVPVGKLREKGSCGRCKRALFEGRVVDLTRFNFQQHLNNSDLPVVVDFWAPWCGPCRSFAPVFAAAAAELEPELRFAKIDTEAEQGLAAHFGIRSIPTLIIFSGGRESARQSGAMDRGSFMRWVRSHIERA